MSVFDPHLPKNCRADRASRMSWIHGRCPSRCAPGPGWRAAPAGRRHPPRPGNGRRSVRFNGGEQRVPQALALVVAQGVRRRCRSRGASPTEGRPGSRWLFRRPGVCRAATCLRLARRGEPDLLETALRKGLRADRLEETLQIGRGRPGQVRDRRSRERVRDNPWSAPESALHRLFREAGIVGWSANPRVRLAVGARHPDVLFEDVLLVVEVDGHRFHRPPRRPKPTTNGRTPSWTRATPSFGSRRPRSATSRIGCWR